MKAKTPLLLLIAMATAACSAGGLQHRVSTELVGALPKDARISLETKERHLQDARTAHDTAERELTAAMVELHRATFDRELTESRIVASRERLELSQTGKLTERAEHEARVGTALEELLEANREEISWRELWVDYTTTKVALAAQRIVLAEAELEASKADAISKSTIQGKETVVLTEYQLQVSEHLEKTSDLERQSSEEWAEVKEGEKLYNEARARIPADASPEGKALESERAAHSEAKAQVELMKKRIEELEKLKRDLETSVADAQQKAVNAESVAADREKTAAAASD